MLPDADLELVVSETLRGRLLMNGQACAATKRIVAHRDIADELTDRLAVALGKVTMGDPVDPASDLGPLIDPASADRVAAQLQRVVSDGGHVVLGRVVPIVRGSPPRASRGRPQRLRWQPTMRSSARCSP